MKEVTMSDRITIPADTQISTTVAEVRPKVTRAEIVLHDADGGTTAVVLTGDNLESQLTPPHSIPAEMSFKKYEKPRPIRMHTVAGTLAIAHIMASSVAYTPPPMPKARWKVGDKVRLPKRVLSPGTPHRERGFVAEVDEVTWLKHSKRWAYHFVSRSGYGLEIWDSPELDGIETVDDWPYAKGEFVTYDPDLLMGSNEVFQLLRRVEEGEKDYSSEMPAWWLSKENGPTGTYLYEDQMQRVSVKVHKTQTWERG
jgi:hypothetical protein